MNAISRSREARFERGVRLRVAQDRLAHELRRAACGHHARRGELVAHLRSIEAARDRRVQSRHDFRRRAGGRKYREPDLEIVAAHTDLGQRRHIREQRLARDAGNGERPQLPGLDMRIRRQDGEDRDLHVAREQRGHHGRHTDVRNVMQVRPAELLEHLRSEHETARGRAVIELARMPFAIGDQIRYRVDRHGRDDHEHQRIARDHRDRLEIARRIVGRLVLQDGNDRHLPIRRGEKRVAIRRGRGDVAGGDHAVRTGLDLDHDRLTELFAQLLGQHPRADVDPRTGRRPDHNPDQPRRVALAPGAGRRQRGDQHCDQEKRLAHELAPDEAQIARPSRAAETIANQNNNGNGRALSPRGPRAQRTHRSAPPKTPGDSGLSYAVGTRTMARRPQKAQQGNSIQSYGSAIQRSRAVPVPSTKAAKPGE